MHKIPSNLHFLSTSNPTNKTLHNNNKSINEAKHKTGDAQRFRGASPAVTTEGANTELTLGRGETIDSWERDRCGRPCLVC